MSFINVLFAFSIVLVSCRAVSFYFIEKKSNGMLFEYGSFVLFVTMEFFLTRGCHLLPVKAIKITFCCL